MNLKFLILLLCNRECCSLTQALLLVTSGVSNRSIFYGHHIFLFPTRYSRDFSSFHGSPFFKNPPSVRCANGAYLVYTNFDIFSESKPLHTISLYIDILEVRGLFQHNLYGNIIIYVSCVVCVPFLCIVFIVVMFLLFVTWLLIQLVINVYFQDNGLPGSFAVAKSNFALSGFYYQLMHKRMI